MELEEVTLELNVTWKDLSDEHMSEYWVCYVMNLFSSQFLSMNLRNMKLEAVNPLLPEEEVCVATITAVRGSYLWLQLEGKYQLPREAFLWTLFFAFLFT